MKLLPVRRSDAGVAAALLAEGFPELSHETWAASLSRIFTYGESLGHDTLGQFASVKDHPVGICLTIPSLRAAYAGPPRETVNLSAFYLRPGNEWMATLFMRRLMADPAVDYVDLTASASMRQLNRRLGFVDRSRGAVVVPLVLSCLRPSLGARVVSFRDIAPDALPEAHRAILQDHARLGCLAAGIEIDGACHPLILAPCRRRGVRGARVILVRDRQLIQTALGAVARYLVKRGILFLEFESLGKDGFPEALFRTGAWPVQTTHDPVTEAIDHTFSELVFVPSPGMPVEESGAGSTVP